jgi:hypothetical protein
MTAQAHYFLKTTANLIVKQHHIVVTIEVL